MDNIANKFAENIAQVQQKYGHLQSTAVSYETKQLAKERLTEAQNKRKRGQLLDAYRKYQAAVMYGEIERNFEVDDFVIALKDKNWSVLNNIPKQLRYFMG